MSGTPTRWGDRAGRRRDILHAARTQIAERGYLALNMRDIAAGAGVSAGTLYSYFATKEEIFVTLYAEAVEAHTDSLVPLCDGAPDLETFITGLYTSYLELYASYGRHFSLWTAVVADPPGVGGDGPVLPAELTAALRKATVRQGRMVSTTLQRLTPGRHVAGETRRRQALVWATMSGVAEHLTSDRHLLSGVEADELIAYTARTLAAGLRDNVREGEVRP
jgi:AcrR family transcriptional regulator